ncbi:unnamed protein product [Lampetra planeri]
MVQLGPLVPVLLLVRRRRCPAPLAVLPPLLGAVHGAVGGRAALPAHVALPRVGSERASGGSRRSGGRRGWRAPHELCSPEERRGVWWEATVAGKVAATSCPHNTSGVATRACVSRRDGTARWEEPSFARCLSLDFLALTQSVGDGVGAALRSDALPADPVRLVLRLAQLTAAAAAAATTAAAATETAAAVAAATREAAAAAVAGGGGGRHGRGGRPLYGGELLATVGLLRAALARLGAGRPSERDLQCIAAKYLWTRDVDGGGGGDCSFQAFLQVLNNLLLDENKEVWEDAQKLSPIAADLLSLVVELMHAAARSMKPFHNPYHCLDNFVIGLYKFPLFRAESDVSFPMRARRGMASWARNTRDKIHISHRSLSAMATGSEAPAVIGTVLFRNLSYIFPTGRGSAVINSRIFAVTVRPTPSAVTAPVEIEFTHLSNETDNVCVVWDPKMTTTSAGLGTTSGGRAASGNAAGSAAWASGLAAGADHGARIGSSAGRGGGWSARGCAPVAARPGRTRCRCHSLDAAFAILARREADSLDMDQASTLSLTLVVGCTVSSLALLCLIVVYALYWRVVRSERAVILINLCISIISSNGLILLAQTLMQQRAACVATAALLHFTFLASFCWVLAEAWHAYTAVGGRLRRRLIHKRFLLLGWGFPAMTVAFSCGLTKMKGYGTHSYCWLSLEGGLLYSFVGPAAVVVLINMVIGILVFNKLVTRNGVPDKIRKDAPHRASLWSSCVVLPLLALTWMSAVLAITDRRSSLFQVLFSVFDSLQGLVITAVHCFLRREVQVAIRRRLRGCQGEVNDCSVNLPNGHSVMMGCEKSLDGTCTEDPSKEALIGPAFPVLHHPHLDTDATDGAQEGDDDEGGGGGGDDDDGGDDCDHDDADDGNNGSDSEAAVVQPADGEAGAAGKSSGAKRDGAAGAAGEGDGTEGPSGDLPGEAAACAGAAAATEGTGGEAGTGSGSRTGVGLGAGCRGARVGGNAAPAQPAPPSLVESVPLLTQRPYTYLGSEGINELQNYCTRRDEGEGSGNSSDARSQSSDVTAAPVAGNAGTKAAGGGVPGKTDASDAVSNASESSLERRKSKYSDLDFEKIMHTRKRHKEMLNQPFMDKDTVKVDSEVKDVKSPRAPLDVGAAADAAVSVQKQQQPPPLPLRPPRRSVECERPGAELPLVYQEGDLQTEV